MAKCTLPIYDKCEDVYKRITASANGHIYINTIYEDKQNGFKWLLNSRLYLHIYRPEPCKCTGGGYYILQHYRLKPDGNLANAGYNLYTSKEDLMTVYNDLK